MSRAGAAALSLWLKEALDPAEEQPPMHGNLRGDVCIVGGGLTGLWTALALKEREPALDVVLLEADVCGAGASGWICGGARARPAVLDPSRSRTVRLRALLVVHS
jgi:glycine/D-amino acid oxidase-like deaminating enzyme